MQGWGQRHRTNSSSGEVCNYKGTRPKTDPVAQAKREDVELILSLSG